MDIDVSRMRALLDKREEIDQELQALVTGTKERKQQTCSICGSADHNARVCPNKIKVEKPKD